MLILQRIQLLLLCLIGPLAVLGQGTPGIPDLVREQRMADEITDAILDGEPEQLETRDGRCFLAIFTPSEISPARGSVVILHGRGLHPDWVDAIQPLRVELTAHGWNTLAIQLPVLKKSALYYDYVAIFGAAIPRIEAAFDRIDRVAGGKRVLLAHSCGSHMAQHWIHQRGREALARFDAYIGIGMGATDRGQSMREPFALADMPMPLLDLSAEHDFASVHRLAPERLAALRHAGNPLSDQQVVPDAEHYFVDRGQALVGAVAAWLNRL